MYNFTNITYSPIVIEVKDLCVQGINNTQTTLIIVLNIVFFMFLYFYLYKQYLKDKNIILRVLSVFMFALVIMNGFLLYYWVVF